MQPPMGVRRGSRAFSLMELMISVGILSTAILLVTGVYLFLFRASQKSVDLTAGTVVAESILREYQQRLIYDPSTCSAFRNSTYATDTPIQSGSKSLNQAVFNYTIYAMDMNSLLGLASTPNPPPPPLRRLRVVCSWWDSGRGLPGADRGLGQLTVELNRMVMYDANY